MRPYPRVRTIYDECSPVLEVTWTEGAAPVRAEVPVEHREAFARRMWI